MTFLSFEKSTDRSLHAKYYLLTVEIKDYNQPVKTI